MNFRSVIPLAKAKVTMIPLVVLLAFSIPAAAKVKLAFTTDWPADQFKSFLAEFEKKYPGIDVAMTAASSPEKIWTAMAAGSAPDVLYVRGTDVQTYIQSGILQPLDPYIKAANVNMGDFIAAGLTPYKDKKGSLYALPYDWCPIMTFYNKAYLSAAGIPPLTDSFSSDDLMAYVKKLKQSNGDKVTRYGISAYMGGWGFEGNWLKGYGGRLFNDDETQVLITEKGAINALDYAQKLFTGKFVGGTFPKVGLSFSGTWDFKAYVKTKDEWDIGPLPKGPADWYGTAMGSGYAMSKGSKHKKEAWTFINELMGPLGMELVWAKGTTPSRKSGLKHFYKLYSNLSVKYVEPSMDHSWAGRPMMPPGEMTTNTVLDPPLAKLMAGSISPEQAAQKIKADIESLWKSRRRKK